MNTSAKGALWLLLIGLAVLAGLYGWNQFQSGRQVTATSDASRAKGALTLGMDNFIGYFPLCSPRMRQLMLADGYKLDCVDDKADYAHRFEKLARGELDLAVATVDAYLLGGMAVNYPGVIIAVVDESQGGDAIVARQTAAPNLTQLKERQDLKVAFTPDSPSHHLLKAVGVHFDIPLFRRKDSGWRVESNGSSDALKALLDGKAQVAALWEPDVSKALSQPGMVKLLGSDQTDKLIVDILIVNRDFLARNGDAVRRLLDNAFQTLAHYRQHPTERHADAAAYAGVTPDVAKRMLEGVRWISLPQNATQWFGVAQGGVTPTYGLFETIERTLKILQEFGDISGNPLPGQDPRGILNSDLLRQLYQQQAGPAPAAANFLPTREKSSLEAEFAPLTTQAWERLREVGALKVRPILFQSGTALLDLADKQQLDQAADALRSYPGFRIEIQGHAKPGGDEAANLKLSQQRADAVTRYLRVAYGLDPDRVRSVGYGASQPLARQPGEKFRAWRDRQSRVTLVLKQESF
ncbi:phosphate ABC transporter substrate-binding/OmpA family protein [Magnetofaba australis]|uniref:Putative OmpA/MotB domain-containing protein n=1 Tax=Magnetofaba australis IT-1 TaxID=1434232 RepID=A0A1Y2K1W0_9PROT|nr:phosphate ABC transporter substrate-binding/OmpA family protein [Magnetofaba australis]OSM01596.1 putative OmpA/MotB domain-containing protein [Magnetofaba australis IT-1]